MSQPPFSLELLEPHGYQQRAVADLKREEAAIWDWFASSEYQRESADGVRLELLKTSCRLERCAEPALHATGDAARAALGLDIPLHFYQMESTEALNAALLYVPGEGHLAFSGPLRARLDPAELGAVIAHELGHYVLYDRWRRDYFVASQVLAALAADIGARPAHIESDRRFSLYTEVFADRAGLALSGDPDISIRSLLKTALGLETVDVGSFLRQADEVLARDGSGSAETTHPETYLRARALALWAAEGREADAAIGRLIDGPLRLDALDLMDQRRLEALTRRVLGAFLKPRWLRTDGVIAHAQRFFPDLAELASEEADDAELATALGAEGKGLEDYLAYLLLDFVAVARELEEAPLAAALLFARAHGFEERLVAVACKDLALARGLVARLAAEAGALVGKLDREQA